jgi:hypothetical protein
MPIYSTALQVIPEASIFDRGWRFLMDQLIQDVPESIALCEFDCREPNCTAERWAACERRIEQERLSERKSSGLPAPCGDDQPGQGTPPSALLEKVGFG